MNYIRVEVLNYKLVYKIEEEVIDVVTDAITIEDFLDGIKRFKQFKDGQNVFLSDLFLSECKFSLKAQENNIEVNWARINNKDEKVINGILIKIKNTDEFTVKVRGV